MYNDYELVYLAQENNEDAKNILYNKYHNYICKIARTIYQDYKFYNMDLDDIKLECNLVLDNAINKYNQDKDIKFISYLKLCLNSRLTDFIRKKYTKDGKVESNIKSLDEDNNGIKLYDTESYNNYLIENNYIDIENIANNIYNNISNYEKIILKLLLEGKKPDDISKYLNTNIKKIYNTIYRLKVKIKNELN